MLHSVVTTGECFPKKQEHLTLKISGMLDTWYKEKMSLREGNTQTKYTSEGRMIQGHVQTFLTGVAQVGH